MICKSHAHSLVNLPEIDGITAHTGSGIPSSLHAAWDALAAPNSVFLKRSYCEALNAAAGDVSCRFAWFMKNGELLGIAAFQIATAEALLSNENGAPRFLQVAKSLFGTSRIARKILILGNSFATGEHGFAFSATVPIATRIALVSLAADAVVQTEKATGNKLSAVLVKDFFDGDLNNPKAYKDNGYGPIRQEPSLLMPLPSAWKSFDDYLAALNTKYRTKAKAALQRSSSLELRVLSIREIEAAADELYALYDNVRRRAEFRIGSLNRRALPELAKRMDDDFQVTGFYLDGQLVGFQSAFRNCHCLDAHFVGFDYELNHRYAIYPRMLYEFIKMGIEGGYKRINFGRTATEIKSTVGAVPVDMHCYIRHTVKAKNVVLQIFANCVDPDVEKSHLAYRKSEWQQLSRLLPTAD